MGCANKMPTSDLVRVVPMFEIGVRRLVRDTHRPTPDYVPSATALLFGRWQVQLVSIQRRSRLIIA